MSSTYYRTKNLAVAKPIAKFFREQGKVFTWEEYRNFSGKLPLAILSIKTYFRNYSAMLDWVKKVDPTLEADLKPKPKPVRKAKPAPAVKKVTIDE